MAIEKLNVDWLVLEYDNNITGAYDVLNEYTTEQIAADDNLFAIFKSMFFLCKKEYVRQVNKQIGTFIRHGVMDAEFTQLLKKYQLFIPECDEKEKRDLLCSNDILSVFEQEKQSCAWTILQKNCLDLFRTIEHIKDYIYFTHEKRHEKYTTVYIESNILRERLKTSGDIDNIAKFINEIKALLDRMIIESLSNMRKLIEEKLTLLMNKYFQELSNQLYAVGIENNFLNEPRQEFLMTIEHIGEWFQVISDSTQIFNLKGYLKGQSESYSEIQFDYTDDFCPMPLATIKMIDIILVNLIRNIEVHSGFHVNPQNTNAKIKINTFGQNNIQVIAENVLDENVDLKELNAEITKINQIMDLLIIGQKGSEDFLASSQKHGKGLYNLGHMLYMNYSNFAYK